MKIALPVDKNRNVTTFDNYHSVDIFTFKGTVPISVESLPKLTAMSLNLLLPRSLAKKGVNGVLASDMSEQMIAAFLKRGVKVKLGAKENGKAEAIRYVEELIK